MGPSLTLPRRASGVRGCWEEKMSDVATVKLLAQLSPLGHNVKIIDKIHEHG